MKKILVLGLLLLLSPLFANIQIDGDLKDWNNNQKLNLIGGIPPSLVEDNIIYGAYSSSTKSYKLAFETKDITIGPETTIWINSDNDENTGHKVWEEFLGAEYFIDIGEDNKPYLFTTKPFGDFVAGPLDHSFNVEKTILEISLDENLIGNPKSDIKLLSDINDSVYLPDYYSDIQLKISKKQVVLPKRTDFSKRIGIVFSKSSQDNFYDANSPLKKAYNQLFMSVQHQTMMAGIPFDLINEEDLTDIKNIVNYDVLLIPSFTFVPKDKLKEIKNTLYHAVYTYNIGIITSSDFLTNYADGSSIEGDSYRHMKQLLGLTYGGGNGPVSLTLNASNNTHIIMKDYKKDETVFKYDADLWYSYFKPVANANGKTLAINNLVYQKIEGLSENLPAIVAIENGGRNVHFSTLEYLGNTNLLWSAIQWSLYGDLKAISLKMGRFKNLFVSRNDMDQSQEIHEVKEVDGKLLDLLTTWKQKYGFVGSYYINVGNNLPDQFTDWNYSKPLYKKYIALGNEIGTHSYTHPHDTNELGSADIEFEFNQSLNIITEKLNPTWRDENIRGAAVPGAPEGTKTANEIMKYTSYLTGGYSSLGAGFSSAIGYLDPSSKKVYLSPNMNFDFSMMEYGLPVYNKQTEEWIPQKLTATQAEARWKFEYETLTSHAKQPIIHWPWHDYGPTISLTNDNPYSLSMFENTISLAYKDNSEFITAVDVAQRIETFRNSKLDVKFINDKTIKIDVDSNNVGKFAIDMQLKEPNKIKSVNNWYAYNNKKVFLAKNGASYTVNIATRANRVTRVYSLPMRAELISLNGNSSNLTFTFKGQGLVKVKLKKDYGKYKFSKASKINYKKKEVQFTFNNYGTHTITIREK